MRATRPPYGGETTYGEDCLYLNVTTPARARFPVMVWVHGGSNTTGSGSAYNAAKLAVDGDVVVVTINYRLGPLGWLAHPGLETGADRRYQAGNYGLLDQQAALRWVQRNARTFGGDPRNVTLFGESAAAADSCANLVSPSAAGLFHKVSKKEILGFSTCLVSCRSPGDVGQVRVGERSCAAAGQFLEQWVQPGRTV